MESVRQYGRLEPWTRSQFIVCCFSRSLLIPEYWTLSYENVTKTTLRNSKHAPFQRLTSTIQRRETEVGIGCPLARLETSRSMCNLWHLAEKYPRCETFWIGGITWMMNYWLPKKRTLTLPSPWIPCGQVAHQVCCRNRYRSASSEYLLCFKSRSGSDCATYLDEDSNSVSLTDWKWRRRTLRAASRKILLLTITKQPQVEGKLPK